MKRFFLFALSLLCLLSSSFSSTVYFINSDGWTTVNAYVWGDNAKVSWPGEAMTKTAQQINGFDVYSYDVDETTYPNIIFTNKTDGSDQTSDLKVADGVYYYWKDKKWYATADDVPALDENPPVVTPVTDPMNEAYWNFGQDDLKDLGEISGNVTVRGMTLVGGEKKIKVESKAKTYTDTDTTINFTHALNVNGTSREGYREVYFPVKKNTTLELYVYGSNNDGIVFSIEKDKFGGTKLADFPIKKSGFDHIVYNYTGSDAELWLSVSKQTYIYSIRLSPYENDPTGIFLAGSFNDWKQDDIEFRKTGAENVFAAEVSLSKNDTIEFKIIYSGKWFGNNGTITQSVTDWVFSESEGNCKLITGATGKYEFTFNSQTSALSVAYPPVKQYWMKHPYGGGDWEWKQLEMQSDGSYSLTDIWGKAGVNIADNENGDNSDWIEESKIANSSNAKRGATVTFVYDPDTKQVSLTDIKNPESYVEEYYIKHPWGGGSWEWQKMEMQADSTFAYTGLWGDNGVNIADNAAGNDQQWITKKDIVNYELAELGDTVTFVYYPKDNKVELANVPDHGQTPIPDAVYYIKHGWADGQDSSWSWQPMTKQDNGDWTYRGLWGGTGVDINTEPKDSGDDKQYFETVEGSQDLQLGDSALFTFTPAANSIRVELIGTHSALNYISVEQLDEEIYNVLGQKVEAGYKGIIIRKGKKYIIR